MSIVGCRVPSSVTSSKTLHDRSQQLGQVRQVVSGGSRCEQPQDELGHMTKEDKEAIRCEAAHPVKIPTDHGLALKSDLQLPWNKMRAICRYEGTYVRTSQRSRQSFCFTLERKNLLQALDLAHVYQQIPLDEEFKKLVVVNTHKGLFCYNRLPFSLSAAPAIFWCTIPKRHSKSLRISG